LFLYFLIIYKTYIFAQQLDEEEEKNVPEDFADDAYLMVSQLHWEDEVVWNGDDIKHKVMSVTLMNVWSKNWKVQWMRYEVLTAVNFQTAVNGE
jgi:hypothetical protein